MKISKGKRELNLVREDVKYIQRFYMTELKSIDEVLGDLLNVFEQMFQTMQENPYLAEGFGYAIEFYRKLIKESNGQIDSSIYEGNIEKLARQYGINYFQLVSQTQLQVPKTLDTLEISNDEKELAKKVVEKGRHPKKLCTEINETCRIKSLLDMLKRTYDTFGEENESFREIYKSYYHEIRLRIIGGKDISEYPMDIEGLKENFRKRIQYVPIDYTYQTPSMGIGTLS